MRVAKLGNDLAITLPAEVVENLSLKEGDEVELRVAGPKAIEIERRMSAEEALEKIKDLRIKLPPDWKFDREEANSR
ncbi:AbrB/MazE/SpoVT family DNA-binding domain-containing protein [Rhizobium sp. KVB221]|uniref:AbrB/MazE/SpoVT family DNA-binding domain-containing protein n=1 Tax=Rhizobium setariae TaxID=2801340 RepID=A0A937CP68_9HYPH|nr:AbrB/MazE/SpoVT family DNA-binding domain-containing protein [Rhizobium setariae]MBL0372083.1 AbrB/MazE/SpoVT family DNA-binding domain-containing protein [Rhizobium setariae]